MPPNVLVPPNRVAVPVLPGIRMKLPAPGSMKVLFWLSSSTLEPGVPVTVTGTVDVPPICSNSVPARAWTRFVPPARRLTTALLERLMVAAPWWASMMAPPIPRVALPATLMTAVTEFGVLCDVVAAAAEQDCC